MTYTMMTRSGGSIRVALSRVLVAGLPVAIGCASGNSGRRTENSPARLAAVRAEPRLTGAETTWVATGPGYELLARTRGDIAQIEPTLDTQANLFQRVFGEAPATRAVRIVRIARDGYAALVPAAAPNTPGPVVDALIDERPRDAGEGANRGQRATGRGGPAGMMRAGGMGSPPAERVVRAWLSARASTLSGSAGLTTQATGEIEDPRVPAWIESAFPTLAMDSSRADVLNAQLAAHDDSLIPLRDLLTERRPPFVQRPAVSSGEGRGDVGRGGGMGGGGMRGGRGGMGGSRGRGGVSGGGGYSRPTPALQGGALFVAEAASFARYLAGRESYGFVGAVADAQIRGKGANDVIATARNAPADVDKMDDEWRRWLSYRAKRVRR